MAEKKTAPQKTAAKRPAAKKAEAPVVKCVKVITELLNVRSVPDNDRTAATVIAQVREGENLKLREAEAPEGWTPVEFEGREAWVMSEFVAK